MRLKRLSCLGIGAVETPIGVTKQDAAFGIDRDVVKVEEIPAAVATEAQQANATNLDRIIRS